MADKNPGELFNSLPAPFREDPGMADFLAAFEDILLAKGLEGTIDRLAAKIDPALAPLEDLRWLAGWMGLTIDADYPTGNEAQYRIFVAQTIARYRQRGTLVGMQKLLNDFTGQPSTVWADEKPHRFVVSLRLDNVRDLNELERLTRVARALIQREKPAHTRYELKGRFQTFQVADLESVGGDEKKRRPKAVPRIASPAQVGHREAGKITVGNMMLGQAPLKT